MEFGVDLDQTAVNLRREMTWNFHKYPCHIFYRESFGMRNWLNRLGNFWALALEWGKVRGGRESRLNKRHRTFFAEIPGGKLEDFEIIVSGLTWIWWRTSNLDSGSKRTNEFELQISILYPSNFQTEFLKSVLINFVIHYVWSLHD